MDLTRYLFLRMVHSATVPSSVLIAPTEHLQILSGRSDLAGTIAFADTDALRALDAITRQRPALVALERLFAATSRGAALINRIKADPALATCEIRIVAHDAPPDAPPDAPHAAAHDAAYDAAHATAHDAEPVRTVPRGAAAAVAEALPVAAPLDQRGTRRAPRFKIVDGVEVLIDSNPATLIDLSLVGAQVVSATSLKPNQRLRISFPDQSRPVRFSAAVAWASFEMPKGGPRYRAGIEFFDADPEAVGRFCNANKK